MIYFIHDDEYVIQLNKRIEKSDFMKAGHVIPGSYAEELLGRIYDCLITYSININGEFQKYYLDEYPNLGSFLYWKYSVDENTVASIISSFKPEGFLAYGSVYSGGDYNIGHFLREESNLKLVNTLFQYQ